MMTLPAHQGIDHALDILHRGGVIAHATETCYGLATDMTNPEAVKKLFAIKKRPPHMPVSALFSSIEEAKQYVEWNTLAEDLATKYLPGPLTLILPLKKNTTIFSCLKYDVSSLGIRISSHPVAAQLAQEFGKPISTTSANLHGQPNPYSIKDIPPCDLILDSGTLPEVPPSMVVDCTGKEPKILRSGGAAHLPRGEEGRPCFFPPPCLSAVALGPRSLGEVGLAKAEGEGKGEGVK